MWKEKVDGYSASLILSEGRHDARERYRELPEVVVEINKKSDVVRVSATVLRRVHSDLKSGNTTKKEIN